ncbi:receptor-type tyrosine-protein phosphatase alpha isoform X2 [Magallana gigas]|uniref:receptor-type tyrosine-protein phosphatase alpha isoform X2 n=1 Tax=Magallana gigas TaxID=29159 RepID=UPI00333FC9C6
MAVLTWLGFVFFLGFSHCYENLARTSSAYISQSTTRSGQYASRANDGNTQTTERYCAHTTTRQTTAWLQVDLSGVKRIKNIKIFYRKEGNETTDWKQYRFRQFYLDVSNASVTQTKTSQRTRCYTDNTTFPNLPPNIIDMPCVQTARYVIVETAYDAPEDKPTTGAILEICEIEVYGCSPNCKNNICDPNGNCTNGCVDRYWGSTCDNSCTQSCKDSICPETTGHCVSCYPGSWGNICTDDCPMYCSERGCDKSNGKCMGCASGRYGDDCDRTCSSGCTGGTCDQYSGTCTCKSSWTGDHCDRCKDTHYGTDCSQRCSDNCLENICNNVTGYCTNGCMTGFYGYMCNSICTTCPAACNRSSGMCLGDCPEGKYGNACDRTCNQSCKNGCLRYNGICKACNNGMYGDMCTNECIRCQAQCDKNTGECIGDCPVGWFGVFCNMECQRCADRCFKDNGTCNRCVVKNFGINCDKNCSDGCAFDCDRNNGSCSCSPNWQGETCSEVKKRSASQTEFPVTEVGAGVGAFLIIVIVVIIAVVVLIRTRKSKESKYASSALFHKSATDLDENKGYTNLGGITVAIEDPDEEPQIEKPEECVYYNNLSVAKDIPVSDLLNIITTKQAKENEGFQKEFKSLPYGERFPCEVAKSAGNIPKNRFKTTFPYDHSRVVLESSKEFNSDYINANYIENMEGKREFIASQGPRVNTVVDHWRMIWQEHVNYIVMLTNLIEGPKVKCHQYWPEAGKEMDVDPFSLTLLEEKVYAYFVVRKMAVRKKKVTGSRTVVQFHYTHWPDHGTPDPLNLVDFLRQFRHKIKPSHHPILVHCSAGIGRTGTFIALDVLSRYGKVKGKVNIIEYVKAMRKDRMTMIQNVDQYVFLYHALYEFFRRSGQFVRKDDFLSEFANLNKAESKKQLSDEFNELTSLKPKYEAKDYKSGKKHQKLNASKSVLPVEKYLVYLTSHIAGRDTYYNAINVSSFTQAEELISAQFPVAGAAIDLVRLLIDEDCSFLVSLNPMSEVKELKDWVNDNIKTIKLDPYEITKHAQTEQSPDIRKTNLKIKGKEDDILGVEILECMSWSSSHTVPTDKSILINFIKQFCLDRRSHPDGRVAVLSKDGAVGCGVFCAVYNAVQQIQQDAEVDMFTIVRQLQVRRPEMISTVEEYELCYDAVHQFLASDSVYANT